MLIFNVQASFTRPADTTAYTSGDLIANSTTAGSVAAMNFVLGNRVGQGQTRITRVRISKTSITTALSAFRLHLYQANPATFTNGDNGAWNTSGSADYLGNIDVPAAGFFAFTDGAAGTGAAVAGSELMIRTAAGQSLYGVLEARAAYVPTSGEIFTVTLEDLQSY